MERSLLLCFLVLSSLQFIMGVSRGFEADVCKCEPPSHRQKDFCQNEFVLKVKIIKSRIEGVVSTDPTIYTASIKKAYKGEISELETTDGFIDFILNECHTFHEGTYIIFGTKNERGQLVVDECSDSRTWEQVSKVFRRALARQYNTGCDCLSEFGPVINGYCEQNYSFLRRDWQGKCKWVKNTLYKECINFSDLP